MALWDASEHGMSLCCLLSKDVVCPGLRLLAGVGYLVVQLRRRGLMREKELKA